MYGKKYFISGGGTGGHIYPAFTIAEKLLKEDDTEKIYYIGNPSNLEYDIAKNYPDIEFLPVNVRGMPRKLTLGFFKWGADFFFSYLKALKYMKKYKPDAVFTTGGYVSAPVVFASITLRHSYMIHDCDSVPGLVSKLGASKADIVSVAFQNSKNVLKSKNIIFNGNPVREVFFTVSKQEARERLNIPKDKKVIFATGGSQGAKTINTAMTGILKTLTEDMNNYVILQTGRKNFDDVINKLNEIYPAFKDNKNLLIKPYFDEMVYPMKASDAVIARAGSLSLTEIIQCRSASVLIPYPYASQDHQRKNAKEMCRRGLALYLEDEECSSENLLSKIKELTDNENTLHIMQGRAEEFAKNNPAEEIIKQLKSTIK